MTLNKRINLKTCVWEITLKCNARCIHCGSHAGKTRPNELSTKEALAIVDDLADLGCKDVTLSGGEPLLRKDWPELAGRINQHKMKLSMITNGLETKSQADAIAAAGFFSIGFSVDGPANVHDKIRNVPNGFIKLIQGAKALVERDVLIGAVTHINRLNLDRLDELHDILVDNGFKGWQVQLTMPHGRAGKHSDELCLAPETLPNIEDKLMAIRYRTPMFFQAADNIGYMSRYEPRLRAGTTKADKFYTGCSAGLSTIGLTSDGTVRGCLSMPPTQNEDNVRKRPLAEIWNDPNLFTYNRRFKAEQLTDNCKGCTFGKICRGGCKSMAMAATGNTTYNPYCLHTIAKNKDISRT